MTVEDAKRTFLSFEGSFESEHMGHPDFRVKSGIFATTWPDDGDAVLRLPLPLAESLVAQNSASMRLVSRSGGAGWVRIKLAQVEKADFQPLAELAYEACSKKK
ncbi:MAG: MmcQ/YjbR family DNA-binding protein [Armatimonadetes bacterium]|nr:MmcQ/YjbR family DNA-binding protein [Armatimonadota bacterium]